MAFDDKTRGRLQKLVTASRGLLTDEFRIQVQQTYGLDPNTGDVTPLERLTHLSAAERETADLLRQTLAHYLAAEGLADSANISAPHRVPVIDRIVREQAFTVLNRLAALLMMEARGVLLPAISAGQQSKAFELYKLVAGSALGETGQAYQIFLFSLFDEFAQELPALFDRFAPQGRLFPREAALLQVLVELNHHEIQPLWGEDETIGWIYQYFNSKEERKAMRDASQAPRNSRELAVRNQFFTPRYVVEFLVDNTLGRLWFNATGGQTGLRERCQYLLVKPDEQPAPALRLRDPRTLRLLDPACGSMHFGLYAFDLFLAIYREAWDWEQAHGAGSLDVSTQPDAGLKPLCQSYADQAAYLRDVPRLVVEHNIHGVDIDPRAAQIASLALWLRAQRAWHDDGVKSKDRPGVGQGHVIAATAPPAEKALRDQLAAQLDGLDAELFTQTLQMLKGVPELGVLLQVERELPRLVRAVFGEHGSLFKEADVEQWRKAEARLRAALSTFAQAAKSTYQGRLFAQDALQGLRLIDICREVFDVVVMNPPFGLPVLGAKESLKKQYADSWTDYYNAFIKRATQLLRSSGVFGAVVPNRLLYTKKSTAVRELLSSSWGLQTLVDAGRDVMDDAAVDALFFTAARPTRPSAIKCPVLNLKSTELQARPGAVQAWVNKPTAEVDFSYFRSIPGNSFSYAAPIEYLKLWSGGARLDPDLATVATGGKTFDDARFLRLRWEVIPDRLDEIWASVDTGGDYQLWYAPSAYVQKWGQDGAEIRSFAMTRHSTDAQVMQSSKHWNKPGISYPYTSSIGFSPRILPAGTIFSSDAIAIHSLISEDALPILGLLASNWTSELLSCFGEGRKTENSLVKSLPMRIDEESKGRLKEIAENAIRAAIDFESKIETSPLFHSPYTGPSLDIIADRLKGFARDLNDISRLAYGISDSSHLAFDNSSLVDVYIKPTDGPARAHRTISYLVGVAFGRWDIRCATGEVAPRTPVDVFEALPKKPSGLLDSNSEDESKPTIYANDASGLQKKIQAGLLTIYGKDSETEEQRILQALGYSSIENYLMDPSGFFQVHQRDYSRGARKAPIFWPLSTESGSYQCWIYYPNLTNQTLYAVINDFIEPKLKQVSEDAGALRGKGSARTRDDDKLFEALQGLEAELLELRDKLQEMAPGYKPNHDDGVQITAAPLWPLLRHKPWQKLLKDTWSKLEKGDYDWAHVAMAYWPERVREKCQTDKSLAIAHGLEDLYVEPAAAPKKTRGRKKAADTE